MLFSRQNSVCLGSSLSMRSFAIEESNSPIPTLRATLLERSIFRKGDFELLRFWETMQRVHNLFSFDLKWTNLGLTKSEVWESIQGNFGAVEQLCANLSQKWILPKSKFHRRRRASLSVWFTLILQNLAASSVGRHHAVLHWRHQISICYLDWTANSL